MRLYYSPTSPFVRKVAITAIEAGVYDRITNVPISAAPQTPNRDYAAHNPLMKIPALERDDATTLFDSVVICEYLDHLGGGKLFPPPGEARWASLRLHALADGILDAALLLRYETAARPEPLRWPEWIAGHSAKIDCALDAAEREVPRLPANFEIGQIGLVCALGYLDLRFPDLGWRQARPQLAQWMARISERDSAKRTVPAG